MRTRSSSRPKLPIPTLASLGVGFLTCPAWAQFPIEPGPGSGKIQEPGLVYDLSTLDYEIAPPAPENFIGYPALQLIASQYQASGRPAMASLPAFPSNDLIAISDKPNSTGDFLHLISQPGRFNASFMISQDVVHGVNLPKMGVGDRDAILVRHTNGNALVYRFNPTTNGHTEVTSTTAGYGQLAVWGGMSAYWTDASGNLLGHNGTSVQRSSMDTNHEPPQQSDAIAAPLVNALPQTGTGGMPGVIVKAAAIEWTNSSTGDEIALLVDNGGLRHAYIAKMDPLGGDLVKLATLFVGETSTPPCLAVSRGTLQEGGAVLVDCLAMSAGVTYGGVFLSYCFTWCNPDETPVSGFILASSKPLALTSHNTAASGAVNNNDLLVALDQDQRVLALKREATGFSMDANNNYYQLASGYQANLLSGGDMDGDGDIDALVGITGGTRYATVLMRQKAVRQQFRATRNPSTSILVTTANNGNDYHQVTMRLDRGLPAGMGSGSDLANAAAKIQVELFTHATLELATATTARTEAARLASTISSLTAGQTYFDVTLTYPTASHPANGIYHVSMRYLDSNNLPVGPALMALYVPFIEPRPTLYDEIWDVWPEFDVDGDNFGVPVGGGVIAGDLTPVTKKRPPPPRQTPTPVTQSEQKAPGT